MKTAKKVLALLLSVLMVFTMVSSSVVAVAETIPAEKTQIEDVENKVTNAFETVKGIIDGVHNLVGGILSVLGKECVFCDEVHGKADDEDAQEPTEPETPPSEPEVPAEPEQPTEPETPVEPEQPTEPETPVEPEEPTEPEEPKEDESAEDQIGNAFDSLGDLFDSIHNLVGSILAIFGKECPFCDKVHGEKDVEEGETNEPDEDGCCTVIFDLNYEGAPEVEKQKVKAGECAVITEIPEREGYVFVGWYTTKDYTTRFDFDSVVEKNIVLIARWVNIADKSDTDKDGLTDALEEFFGTDITKSDTDGDGLSDYLESLCLNYNPLLKDSDKNAIDDGDEDYDSDGLTNKEEVRIGTDLCLEDTDADDLTDKAELNIGTAPINEDTDGDSVSDGKEIELGTDPLVAQSSFDIVVSNEEDDSVKASVEIELEGSQVETLHIEAVENDTFFPDTMPGYLGKAYDFSVEGNFDKATISFAFDPNELSLDSEPTIYYFNEETQELEELPTTVEGNVAKAEVTHFSKYILVDRTIYEKSFSWIDVWDSTQQYTGVELVLVIDDSGSMTSNDRSNQRLSVAQNLINGLPQNSKIGIVKFASSTSILTSSLTMDKEIAKSYLTTSYFKSSGGTYMYEAINSAFGLFETTDETIMKVVVVLSDGATSNTGKHSATVNAANSNHIKIYTVGLGSSTSYFNSYLKPLAVNTGGAFYLASNADQLSDIYANISQKIDIETDSDKDGIPDYYEDNMIIFSGVKIALDKNKWDTDGDGLKDGEEVELKYEYNDDHTKVKVTGKINCDPLNVDSDGDGIIDKYDDKPFIWNISDRDLAMLAQVCYEDIPASVKLGSLSTIYPSYASNIDKSFKKAASLDELNRWKVFETHYAKGGLQIAVYEVDKQLVFACRGSEDKSIWYKSSEFWKDWVVADGLGWLTGFNAQAPAAKSFVKKIMKRYPTYDVYVTGHSLGGNVAYNLASKAIDVDNSRVKKINTYNGLGLLFGITLGLTDLVDEYRLDQNKEKITNYSIDGDPVYALSIFHYGEHKKLSLCDGAYGAHDLYSFFVHLTRGGNLGGSGASGGGGR